MAAGHRARADGGSSFLSQHGVSTAAAALGVFLLAKCFAASHFSTTTASALLTAAPVGVLLGTLTSTEYFLWPWLAAASVGIIAWYLYVASAEENPSPVVPLAAIAMLVLASSLSVPRFLVVALAGTALVILASVAWTSERFAGPRENVRSWLARHQGRYRSTPPDPAPARRGQAFSLAMGIPLAALGLGFLLFTLPDLWLPTDGIIFDGPQGQKRVVVGHVIEENTAWTTVLRAGDRRLERVPSAAVDFRRICFMAAERDPGARNPLMTLFLGETYESPNRSCDSVVETAHLKQGASYVCGSGLPRWESRPRCRENALPPDGEGVG